MRIEQARTGIKAEQVSFLLAQGKVSLEQNEWAKAVEFFDWALKLAPDCEEAALLLTEARAGLDQPCSSELPVKPPRPISFPEEIRLAQLETPKSQAKPLKPTSFPEDVRLKRKPKDLPK
jgi:hypothetical protein